ncbi:MAG: AAA family ATPase [Chloroflexi bacterium]|nr:AAA family ATPase [Chloroflexota bacterium]
MSVQEREVPAEKLAVVCNPQDLGFETTDELRPLEGTIGQERAVSALELALDIDAPGFNLFISGVPGTGRNTALRSHVERIAATKPVPSDWGYLYNFQDPSQPVAISLPCGMMKELARDMSDLVDGCRQEVPKAFESDDYTHRVEEVVKGVQDKRQALTNELEQEAQKGGFALSFTQTGITPVPVVDGRPINQEEFAGLSEEQREALREKAEGIQHSITHAMQEFRKLNQEATDRVQEVDVELLRFTLTPIIYDLQAKYLDHPEVGAYLGQVETDMAEHLDMFKPSGESPDRRPGPGGPPSEEDGFGRYRVNDLVDNSTCEGAPVIFEYSPTYYNLFGRIDYQAKMGTLTTDLTMVRPGAIHRANGGYLVVQARDLLASPLSWETLKRTLRSGEVRIENIGEQYSPLPSTTLRPQPIPVNCKIVLVGSPDLSHLLRGADEDFQRYFKVTADFDTLMDRNAENMAKYAAFVAARSKDGNLRPFQNTAVARIIDYSSRLVQDQEKLTTRFMDVADMLTEANYWAAKDSNDVVTADHVAKAIDQRHYRASLPEERLNELIESGAIHISTEGKAVGQINGLAVMSIGDYVFGKPSRITARTSLGKGQVVNVERETRMSGRIHDKGFMILTGYLRGKYAQDRPLSLSASIGFEQTYSEVDGDSASSTELYALLSAISGLPIDQGIAVTGSVNQSGEVQAIGGATYKIEGYYDVCKAKGLTGSQGVMIPSDNLRNLVLKDKVVDAVRDGNFKIYAVSTVDEGIEVLTGVAAGERGEDGTYVEGTVHHLVEKRLREMAEQVRRFGRDGRAEDGEDQGEP